MELTLQILSGLVALICFLGGTNLMLKGAGSFLPESVPVQRVLDNLLRFLSGIYFGMGFLMTWTLFHIHELTDLIYLLGVVIICSGLGRLYSRIRVGPAGTYFDVIMLFEIALGISFVIVEYLRS